jgi:hypothetical protein
MPGGDAHITHRALDGRRYRYSGRLDLGRPATSVADVAVHGRLHEFTAGAGALGDDVADALGVTGFAEELSYQGGTLLIGRTRPVDRQIGLVEELSLVVWRGRRYCLLTQAYGMSTADLLAVLRTLLIEEHDDGLSARPDPAGRSEFAAPASVVKQVPGLGLLETSALTDRQARTLPTWRGLSTPAGELFRDTLSDGKPYFVLAAADTWTTMVPLADTVAEQVPQLAGTLRIQTVR